MSEDLRRGERILPFLRSFIAANGFGPTVREIGKGVGLSSTATVHKHLVRLEDAGRIKRVGPRAYRILDDK